MPRNILVVYQKFLTENTWRIDTGITNTETPAISATDFDESTFDISSRNVYPALAGHIRSIQRSNHVMIGSNRLSTSGDSRATVWQ